MCAPAPKIGVLSPPLTRAPCAIQLRALHQQPRQVRRACQYVIIITSENNDITGLHSPQRPEVFHFQRSLETKTKQWRRPYIEQLAVTVTHAQQ